MLKQLAAIAITLILCITDAEAADPPPVDFTATCETQAGCEKRVRKNHENINRYVEKKGRESYSQEQINNRVSKACSTNPNQPNPAHTSQGKKRP